MTHRARKALAALLLLVFPEAQSLHSFLPPVSPNNVALSVALKARGGGLFDKKSNEQSDSEWEYYQEHGSSDASNELQDSDSEDYEYYEKKSYDNVQDLNGEFVSDSDDNVEWKEMDSEEEEDLDSDDEDEYLLSTPIPAKQKGVRSRGWFAGPNAPSISEEGAVDSEEEAAVIYDDADESIDESNADEDEEAIDDSEENGEALIDESESLLERANEKDKAAQSRSWFGRKRTSAERTQQTEPDETLQVEDLPPAKAKAKQPNKWIMPKRHIKKRKKILRKTNKSIMPRSSSGATFIYPINTLSSMIRSLPSASNYAGAGGRNFVAAVITSVSKMTTAIIKPILIILSTIFHSTISFVGKWASIIFALLRQAIDALWYGPVDGVTTTGISRAGGFSGLISSSPFIVITSSVLVVGIFMVFRQQMTLEAEEKGNNMFARLVSMFRQRETEDNSLNEEEDEFYDSDGSEPSPEEELQFLNSFDAANPTSRERISKKISKRRGIWPFKTSQKPTPRQEKRQQQRSVKSIQKWWKQRPSNTVQIIEPSRVQQPPLSHQVARLKNQLSQSEQERAVLQSDVARLQHRLQKAHHDAKAIMSKNQWLEKQQS